MHRRIRTRRYGEFVADELSLSDEGNIFSFVQQTATYTQKIKLYSALRVKCGVSMYIASFREKKKKQLV